MKQLNQRRDLRNWTKKVESYLQKNTKITMI